MLPWLDAAPEFPPLSQALTDPNGLLAAGGDLSPQRLLAAYRRGIFPWYAPGDPILWWSPDPRMVLLPSELKITRSLAKTLRNGEYEIRFDTAFAPVMQACAQTPRQGQNGTWISDGMIAAYTALHRQGHAHSVETWQNGKLIGGLYGMAIGRAFFGESMFSHASDASKIALAHLCEFLQRHDFGIIDCQMETSHLASLGARPIRRDDFIHRLDGLRDLSALPGPWSAAEIADCFRLARKAP
ncbi:MAG: leucyl/phenylalanyl-tRNA--protein transferase [Rhodocyclaceae bacterium]|nr:leucyl/phenylalanyl-tRNA--protein transferase [Rhodocyclaceae bacterium]